jgi:citrate lyase subunit beta/citryl-CoA lyase
MRLRSLLFVPGDSERKYERAQASGADALILDLEDSVSADNKASARRSVGRMLADRTSRDWSFFVRPNPVDSGLLLTDLEAVIRPGLDGLIIPKAAGAADVVQISRLLDDLEEAAGMTTDTVKLIVICTETPAAMFTLASYTPPHPRLLGLTWGAEDLAAAIGATSNRESDGSLTFPYQLARAQCLFAAASAGVVPLDTPYTDFRDIAGLEADCRRARRDGFAGRLAIHPDQIATINTSFTPSRAEIDQALAIVSAFDANPGAGTLGIDGKMVDAPHLKAARRLLAAAGAGH